MRQAPSPSTSAPRPDALSPSAHRLLLFVLAAANFSAGMGAFMIIGLLTPLADSFAMSSAQAGWVLTTFAIAYALGSPVLVALTGAWQRRTVLLVGLFVFALATIGSALSTSVPMLLTSRVLVALGAALITPVTAGVAIAVSAPAHIGKALATVFFGLTLAQALGIPAGSYIAYTYGWQASFLVVALLAALSLTGIWWLVPKALPFQANSLATLGRSLGDWRRLSAVLFIASFLGSIYVLYTYFAPLMTQTMGYGRDGITLVLFVFGVGAVIGNFLGGWMSDRFGPMKTLMLLCLVQMMLMPLFSLLPMSDAFVLWLTLSWSIFGWAVAAPQQTRIVQHSPNSQNVALALHASSIYVGVSVGAAVGGLVIGRFSLMALGIAASLCMLLTLGHLLASEKMVAGARAPALGG